ncbi:MAG TPA: NAD(P)/FAD-dependent oxidoreductase [Mucilaginibacter sp.]|nr:NAD(P)/FAD-dependent oxidoreductase [Mucilaginibacter sp.]
MNLERRDFDAVIVGSGPNGLAAGILLQQNGLSVLVVEGKDTVGGGMRSAELTLPGFIHDVCSAIHPLAAGSPFFETLPLADHGLDYIYPEIAASHPFDSGKAAVLKQSLDETAALFGNDENTYKRFIKPIVKSWPGLAPDLLGPLHFPKHPLEMAAFGMVALRPALAVAKRFKTEEARGLFAGMGAHSMLPLNRLSSAAIPLVLMANAHLKGWPMAKGGSQSIANALASYFISLGGKIETNTYVMSMNQLPSSHAILFDIGPRQLLQIAGHHFSVDYKRSLEKYRYGMGVFKVDWALDGPVPFTAEECRHAGTVHIGNTMDEIAASEQQAWNGKIAEKPFVLFAQQSLFDPSRAPAGKHTAWAYCHTPNGSAVDMTDAIESQVERFAPGFRERILAKHTMNSVQVEEYNPNYVGGDINGGAIDLGQLFTRPALRWSPYRTSATGLYICSSSTPPGGGVHGMCGYYAAKRALKDVFGINIRHL